MVRNVMNFGGLAFCAFATYHQSHDVIASIAVAWALWIVMPDPER